MKEPKPVSKTEEKTIPNETQFPKERKEVVEYRPGQPGEDCISCKWFKDVESCEKVAGQIYRSGTCNLWETDAASADPAMEGYDQESVEDLLFGAADE